MKTITKLSIVFILSNFYLSSAQFQKNHALFLSLDSGSQVGLNYLYKQKYSLQVNKGLFIMKSNQVPHDFYGTCLLFPENTCLPMTSINTYEILLGRVLILKNTKNIIRFNLKTGISFFKIETPVNFEKRDCSALFSCIINNDNYSYEIEEKKGIGLVFNPSIEIIPFKYFAISFSPYINFNNKKTITKLHIGVLVGLVRPGNNKKYKK